MKGATEQRGTHTGHFELAPVHKMFMHRLSSPGLGTPDMHRLSSPGLGTPDTASATTAASLNRRSSEASAAGSSAGAAGRPALAHAFGVEQGTPPAAGGPDGAKSGVGAASRWKGVASAFQTASTAVRTFSCFLYLIYLRNIKQCSARAVGNCHVHLNQRR